MIGFELFRAELGDALARSDRAKGGRPPYDAVLMFKVLILQTLYTLSNPRDPLTIQTLSDGPFIGEADVIAHFGLFLQAGADDPQERLHSPPRG